MDEKRYIKLFNAGYTLAKHKPAELNKLVDMIKSNPTLKEPLLAGELQYRKELVQAKMKDQGISNTPQKDRDKGRDQGMDR